MTKTEQHELAQLAGKTRRLPTGQWDLSALDDAELDQLRELVAKGQAVSSHTRWERQADATTTSGKRRR